MCSTLIMSAVQAETSRRHFMRSIGTAAMGLGVTAVGVGAKAQDSRSALAGRPFFFEKVIDCTQVLEPNIPNYFRLNMEITPLVTVPNNGVFVNRLTVPEQYGAHFDTPAHFIFGGFTGESVRPEQLVGPLVIIDVADRAALDPNTEVTVGDLAQWEGRNGRIPPGAF